MLFSPPLIQNNLTDTLLEHRLTDSLSFSSAIPGHVSLYIRQINQQRRMGSGEAHLNSVSQIIACATLIPHSRMVESEVLLEYSCGSSNLGQISRGNDEKDQPCHSGQNHSQLSITQFLFAVRCSVERGSDIGSGFESFIYSILPV